LTKWKLMVLSHSQSLQSGRLTEYVTTSKKLMVQPNLPRFLRVNDVIKLPVKVINNSNESLKAKLYMKITDPRTMNELKWTANTTMPEFSIAPNGSESRTFEVTIPNYDGPVSIAFTSQAGIFSDGEEKTLLVLPNKKFLTESMPFTVRKAGVQNLSFTSLLAANSNTLVHKSLQVEVTSNPAWTALKSLPYLMDYQFNCSEQLFSKLYANLISIQILKSNKNIDLMFENWRKTKGSLESKLSQNQDLKTATLEETPWYYDAMKETERMKLLAESMRVDKLEAVNNSIIQELNSRQNGDGSFSWFPDMQGNEYITGVIVSGFAKLKQLGVDISVYETSIKSAMLYLDQKMLNRHKLIKNQLKDQPCSPEEVQYLYCKAFFPTTGKVKVAKEVKEMIARADLKRSDLPLISMAQLAVAIKLLEPKSDIPASILKAFDEQSVSNEQMGMYWPKNRGGWYWYDAPIETHAAIMEAYQFVGVEKSKMTEMQIWLLRQKQTQSWASTRSTADACYVLLFNGLKESEQNVKVFINSKEVKPESIEPGTGYYKQSIPVASVKPASGNIKVEATKDQFAYGAVYWQYEEELSKVKASSSGLSITKKYYKKVQVDNQEKWVEMNSGDVLKVGDEVKVILSISSDRNLEYVHLKDMRAAGMEPKDVISGYRYNSKLSYQSVTRDLSSNFFIEFLQKGSYEIGYETTVQQAGSFECGVATAQCMYAPEYTANSSGFKVKVE
ncbi:MAG TPA: alpha-2-macroglobulin family protein, partial [Bacteroidia bacterium]